MAQLSPRDYLVGRRTLTPRILFCPGCSEMFRTYQENVECRVCKARPRDFNGQLIEVGDRYFTGNPPAMGRVIKVRKSSLLLEVGADYLGRNRTQGCKSPDKGICVDKIPEEL